MTLLEIILVALPSAFVGLLAFLGAVVAFSGDKKKEKLFTRYLNGIRVSRNLLRQCRESIPNRVIVETQGQNLSKLRCCILRFFYRLFGKKVENDPIVVFSDKPSEQKAYLIKTAVEI